MKTLNRYPVFLYLLPVFFFLLGYTDHGEFLHLKKLILPYLCIYSLVTLFYLVGKKSGLEKNRHALLTFYVALVYLFFGNIKSRFDYIPYIHSYIFFFILLIAFPYVIRFWMKRKPAIEAVIFSYCNVLMLVLCGTQLLLISLKLSKPDRFKLNKTELRAVQLTKTPSIHLILWDGYPGFRSLSEYFKFDNNDLKSYLQSNLYYVADHNHSNYYQTYISVNSLLNMQYISYLHQVPLNEYNTVMHHLQQIDENAVVNFLKSNQYHFYNNSIFEIDGKEVHHHNPKFKSSESIHFNQTFHKRMEKDHLWKFIKGRFKFDFAYRRIVLQQHLQNLSTIENLLKARPQTPHFTYSHIIMPHDPYFTDSIGVLLDRELAGKANNEELYVSYIKYTNLKIKEIVKHLSQTEPNAIVIIMSDHGYREYTAATDQHRKFDNLLAVHFPDTNYSTLNKINSNVNLFRIILNQYFSQQLPSLKDSCISIDEEKKIILSQPFLTK